MWSTELLMWSGSTFLSTMTNVFELFSCVIAVYSCCVSLQAIEAAFNQTVRTVCQTQASQFPGLSPELQLLKTTMTFVRLGAKSCPNLRNVALAFINRNLGDWITQQGGWVGQILVLNSKCSFFIYILLSEKDRKLQSKSEVLFWWSYR